MKKVSLHNLSEEIWTIVDKNTREKVTPLIFRHRVTALDYARHISLSSTELEVVKEGEENE